MALASTSGVVNSPVLTDKVAEEDITEKNAAGQTVVIVPAGQRIPEGVEVPKRKVETEDKARRSAKGKSVTPKDED
jgi:hypothetical protein